MKALMAIFALLFAAPLIAADPGRVMPNVSDGRVISWPGLDGGAAGPMTVWIWLPPGYDADASERFPVLYMNDGQNLFDAKLTAYGQEWQMDEAISRLHRQKDLRRWIVVGVQSPKSRYRALFPEKFLALLSPALKKRVVDLDIGEPKSEFTGDAYARFLALGVKPRVDREFRTLAGPGDTAVMGSSMGGLMAFYVMAEYPHLFGQAAAVSMHVALAHASEEGVDHEKAAADAAETFGRYLASSAMKPGPNRLYIDHGTGTNDGAYGPYSAALAKLLEGAGWSAPNFLFRTFAGAEHNETAWAQRVDIPLAFLDARDP